MRIISGIHKGRKIISSKKLQVRPTTDRAKEGLFNILENKIDMNLIDVLDLFSGVGTLGIEALSRGANSVKFVDNNIKVINILKKNIELLDIIDKCSIVKYDVINYLKNEKNSFDIIFADPPYGKYKFEELYPLVSSLLNKNGLFCFESNKYNIFDEDIKNLRIKKYGSIQVVFWENKL